MHDFLANLERSCRSLGIERRSILVGLSGGADSVALLRGLVELRRPLRLDVQAAHLDHQLRAEAAKADAEWVEGLCRRLDVPIAIGKADVAAAAERTGRGIEEVARSERYRFLEASARQAGCGLIAVAHTADDQAETILHQILRGTGLAGLCGMPLVRELEGGDIHVVRPILGLRRRDVLAWLAHLQQDFREDESNGDEAFTRNRLRRQLIPQLVRDYNPRLVDALCRLAQQASETQAALSVCAADLLERALESSTPAECRLKWQVLAGRPPHLVREALVLLWRRQNWPRQKMGFEHWERLAGIVVDGGAGDLPQGIHARRSGRVCIIATEGVGSTVT